MKWIQTKRAFCLSAGAGLLAQAAPVWAASPAQRAGTVDFVDGSAQLLEGGASRALRKGHAVYAGQAIQTGADTEVHLVFEDGGFLAVRPFSTVRIDQARMRGAVDDTLAMTLLRGALRSITGWIGKLEPANYRVVAATTTIGIRGTDFELALLEEGEDTPAGVHHWVHDGGTTLHNPHGAIDVEPGQAAHAAHGEHAPRALGATPAFLQRRRGRFDARAQKHAGRIREIVEQRLRKRGVLKRGETLEDAKARFQAHRARQAPREPAAGKEDAAQAHHAQVQERRRERLEAARARRQTHGGKD